MWKVVKRLTGGHPMLAEGYTHVCMCTIDDPEGFCNTFLKLSRQIPKDPKSAWVSSPAVIHVRDNHPDSSAGPQVRSTNIAIAEAGR